jgi:hypothetical protein
VKLKAMPKKLERCVTQVLRQGKSKDSAYAICNAALNKKKPSKKKK